MRRAPVAVTHQAGRNHIQVILVTQPAVGTKLQARTPIVSFAVRDPASMRNEPTMRKTERIWSAQAWPYLEQAFPRYPEYCRSSWYSRQSGRIVGFSDKVILQAQ